MLKTEEFLIVPEWGNKSPKNLYCLAFTPNLHVHSIVYKTVFHSALQYCKTWASVDINTDFNRDFVYWKVCQNQSRIKQPLELMFLCMNKSK